MTVSDKFVKLGIVIPKGKTREYMALAKHLQKHREDDYFTCVAALDLTMDETAFNTVKEKILHWLNGSLPQPAEAVLVEKPAEKRKVGRPRKDPLLIVNETKRNRWPVKKVPVARADTRVGVVPVAPEVKKALQTVGSQDDRPCYSVLACIPLDGIPDQALAGICEAMKRARCEVARVKNTESGKSTLEIRETC